MFFPYHPNCITDGETLQEALVNGKEAMEGILEADAQIDGDIVPQFVYADHVVGGTVDVEVPEALIKPVMDKAGTGK